MGTDCDRKLICLTHLEGEIIKKKGRLLALWFLTTRLILMKTNILLLR